MTSIEWLFKELTETWYHSSCSLHILEQAKEMHKQEHSKTWDKSMENLDVRGGNIVRAWEDFDEYYNETFKKD